MLISDLGKIVTGKTPLTKRKEYWDGDIPFVTPGDLQNSKHINSTSRYISEQGMLSVKGTILPKDSVCVSCIGNIGYVGKTTKTSVSNQQINSIIVNDKHNADYVYYLMKSLWGYFKNCENQSTTLSILNKTQFSKIQVVDHSREEEDRIAEFLNMLDLKIEMNTNVNDNLLQQARALYKDRFIDLTPFDGSMPSDWHLGTVSEIIELHDSKRIPLSSRERAELDKIYPYYGATSVMDYVDRYLFDGIYLLLGEDGTVVDGQGFPILQYVEGKFWVNNHAHIITGKNGFTVEMLYLLFSLTNVQSIVTGAVQPKISQANLNKVPVVIPSKTELTAFDESIQPFFAEIRNLRTENDRLVSVRDSLLPRLMSGELDVPDLDL